METLETGHLHILYTPTVEEEEPSSVADVQNLHLVLRPDEPVRYRQLIIGRKRLPDIDQTQRFWGFVRTVTGEPEELRDTFSAEDYRTRTRGRRHQPAARPAGEGVYAIVRRDRDTFLAYLLEFPQEPGPVQEALRIAPEARFVLSVKNPDVASPDRAGLPEGSQADFPPQLRERFAGRRWIGADPPSFLDHEGAEILLIGAEESIEVDGTPPLDPDDEAQLTRELALRAEERPTTPLFEGTWD